MLEMQLSRIVIRETSDQQCIYLKEVDGPRQFPIVIGINEAQAIDRRVRDRQLPRPMTHDLCTALVKALGGEIERVVVCALRDNTFFAEIHLRGADGGEPTRVDARPSDAIALAVQVEAPIFVEESVLETVAPTDPPSGTTGAGTAGAGTPDDEAQ